MLDSTPKIFPMDLVGFYLVREGVVLTMSDPLLARCSVGWTESLPLHLRGPVRRAEVSLLMGLYVDPSVVLFSLFHSFSFEVTSN